MRVIFITNPRSGGGRGARAGERLLALAKAAGIEAELHLTSAPGDARRVAGERGSGDGLDIVAAVGGDGTAHEVADGLAEAARRAGGAAGTAALGVVPVGTGNDLVKTFGVPRTVEGAFDVLRAGRRRRIDLGRAGPLARPGGGERRERIHFVNDLSVGFGALVVYDMARPGPLLRAMPGRLAYFVDGFLRGLVTPAFDAGIRIDGGPERTGAYYEIHVGNGRFCGGGVQFTPFAIPDDGMLDLSGFHGVSRARNFWTVLTAVQAGTLTPRTGVHMDRGERIEIARGRGGYPVYLDGEPLERPADEGASGGALTIDIVRGAIDVVVPG